MKAILASAALAATLLGTAAPASAQWYGDPYVSGPYYGPGYGYAWGGPRVYVAPPVVAVAPPAVAVVPGYPYGPRYRYGPAWGGPSSVGWE